MPAPKSEADTIEYGSMAETQQSGLSKAKKIAEADQKESLTLPYVYYSFGGLMSLGLYFIMLAEAPIFEQLYPGMKYSFFVIMPQYFALPASFIFSKLLESLSLRVKILGLIATMNMVFILIPLISLFLPNTITFYCIMMFVYFIGYTLSVILQGNLVASCSIYGP